MLILASASPRRQELLRNARFVFKVMPAEVPEELREGESPTDFACRLAHDKARAIFEKLTGTNNSGSADASRAGSCNSNLFVLGADTIVVVDEHILGKPNDEADAARMLRLLSGRTHEVTTGVCVVGYASRQSLTGGRSQDQADKPELANAPLKQKRLEWATQAENGERKTENGERGEFFEDLRSQTTQVTFAELSEQEIQDYVHTGESMDKAGAYGIQGVASRWVTRVDGDYFNVVGLPVQLVYRMLRRP